MFEVRTVGWGLLSVFSEEAWSHCVPDVKFSRRISRSTRRRSSCQGVQDRTPYDNTPHQNLLL